MVARFDKGFGFTGLAKTLGPIRSKGNLPGTKHGDDASGTMSIRAIIVTGFSWRLLGHSQYENLSLIQMSDIFGALGVSFLIVMVG